MGGLLEGPYDATSDDVGEYSCFQRSNKFQPFLGTPFRNYFQGK